MDCSIVVSRSRSPGWSDTPIFSTGGIVDDFTCHFTWLSRDTKVTRVAAGPFCMPDVRLKTLAAVWAIDSGTIYFLSSSRHKFQLRCIDSRHSITFLRGLAFSYSGCKSI